MKKKQIEFAMLLINQKTALKVSKYWTNWQEKKISTFNIMRLKF